MLSEVEFCCRRTAHPSGVGNGFSADDNRTYTSLAFNIVTSLSLDAFTAPLLAASGDASIFFSADVLSATPASISRRWGAKTGACERARDCQQWQAHTRLSTLPK